MNILISNDDGIGTEGIRALVRTMKELGDVYVVAPHTQRSASSHALSVNGQISVKKVDFEGAKMAFECDGTPADCVKLGIDLFIDHRHLYLVLHPSASPAFYSSYFQLSTFFRYWPV